MERSQVGCGKREQKLGEMGLRAVGEWFMDISPTCADADQIRRLPGCENLWWMVHFHLVTVDEDGGGSGATGHG